MSERVFVGWLKKRGNQYVQQPGFYGPRATAHVFPPDSTLSLGPEDRRVRVFKRKKQRKYVALGPCNKIIVQPAPSMGMYWGERHVSKVVEFSSKAEAKRAILALCKIEEVK